MSTPLSPLSALSNLSPLGNSAPSTSQPMAAAPDTSGPSWLSGSLAQISVILLGLLLIAAGIFSFDKTREIVVQATKTAAEAAA